MLLQLRPIALIVAIAVALPLLTAGSVVGSSRTAAPFLFAVALIFWTALFYWLRTASAAGRWTYLASGLALGALPWTFRRSNHANNNHLEHHVKTTDSTAKIHAPASKVWLALTVPSLAVDR